MLLPLASCRYTIFAATPREARQDFLLLSAFAMLRIEQWNNGNAAVSAARFIFAERSSNHRPHKRYCAAGRHTQRNSNSK